MRNTDSRRHIRRKLPLTAYLLYLFLAVFLLTGITISKYIVTSKDGDSARVASFGNLTLFELDAAGNQSMGQTYFIAPGVPLYKNPVVSFATTQSSEMAAYVFLAVTTTGWEFDGQNSYSISGLHNETSIPLLSWAVESGWSYLSQQEQDGSRVCIFYRAVPAGQKLDSVPVISGQAIDVSREIYASELARVAASAGDITFLAYAVQAQGFSTPQAAWESVSEK